MLVHFSASMHRPSFRNIRRFPGSLVRSCLAFFATVFLVSGHGAELPKSATLDDVLALATRPEQPTKENGYDVERFDALLHLGDWPKAPAEDEARIATAFNDSLHATNGNIRAAGAWGLGRRGHSEAIPTIMELGEKDPGLIGCFFQLYTHGREVEPPVELLRRGLRSKNSDMRHAILQAIAFCKAITLRADVEGAFESDSSDRVRDEAATALRLLRIPESAAAFRRVFSAGRQRANVVYGLIELGSDADVIAVLPLLKSENEDLRRAVAGGLSAATLENPKPVCDALLEALRDPDADVRLCAVRALGHFREARAILPIRELVTHPPRIISSGERSDYVRAVAAIGGPEAIKLLDDLVQMGYREHFGVEEALIRFASLSSGRAVWNEYLKDPIRALPDGDVDSAGYYEALNVLAACADAELLHQIRERLSATKDLYCERPALEKLVRRIQARLKK